MTGHGRGSKPRPICARKVAYRDQRQAKAAATRVRASSGNPAIRAYECGLCGRWHLTSQAQR